jgi:hypothetical protein
MFYLQAAMLFVGFVGNVFIYSSWQWQWKLLYRKEVTKAQHGVNT